MRKIYSLVFILIHIYFFTQKKNQEYSFYENKGQIVDQNGKSNSEVKYLLNSPGLNVQVRQNGFSYDVFEIERKSQKRKIEKEGLKKPLNRRFRKSENQFKYHRVDITFIDSKSNPEIISEEKSLDYENYYNIPDKKEGVSFVHRYKTITYKNLYNNIDLVFFKPKDSAKPVEYNFLIHPGGKISDIKLKFNGAKTKLKNGKLSMNLRFGEMQENIPNSWIENENKQNITINYKDLGNQIFGFESSINNSDKTIVIDPTPTRIWGSYFGGTGEEYGIVKTDSNNDVYIYGDTESKNNIATTGASQNTIIGGYDSFINKVTKDGQKKLWGTYYGNKYDDVYGNVDFDNSNNVYFVVTTNIPNPAYPGNLFYFFPKIVLLKLKPDGSLEFEKRFIDDIPGYVFTGFPGDNLAVYDVAVKNNKVYLIGTTTIKSGLSTPGAFQEYPDAPGYQSGFITQFDINGNLGWSTYFSGNHATSLERIINTENNYIEILGNTRASNIPMINPIKSVNNTAETDGLYFKFSDTGTLLYSTYLGEPTFDYFQYARRIGDKVYLSGENIVHSVQTGIFYIIDTNTNSIVSQKTFRLFDSLQNWTFIDRTGNLFVTGLLQNASWASQITTPDAYLENPTNKLNAFYIKYDSNLNKIWGTFYVGNGATQLAQTTQDSEGNLFFYGMSSNNTTGIATPGAFQQSGGHPSNDMYIAKFKDCSSFAQLTSNSPVCAGKNIELKANGGANYDWTGPNGFKSNLQNPIILNATSADAGIYTCAVTGTAGCDTTTSITIAIGDNLKPIPDIISLPQIIGDCKTVITTIPTATDNCKGKIMATTTDPLSYAVPGNYTIDWNYDDGNGNIEIQTQQVQITQQPLPVAAASQIFCKIDNKKISDIAVTATNPKWYRANGTSITNLSEALVDNTKYYVTQNTSGCESAKKEILITLSDPNPPTGNAVQTFCIATNPTLKSIIINEPNLIWYNNLGNLIPDTTILQNGQTYFASQIVSGCESTQRLAVKVNVMTNYLSANDFTDSLCNDTTANTKIIDIDEYKKQLIANPQDYKFDIINNLGIAVNGNTPITVGDNIFDVKIKSSLGCYQDVKLKIRLDPKPKIDMRPEEEFCDSLIGVTLDAGSSPDPLNPYTYKWSSGEISQTIKANQEKIYTVIVSSKFGCQNTASIIVKKAKLAEIQNILITNNSTIIMMSSADDYLYSLDEINWQSSNKFENLKNGNYTVYVKTKLDCRLGSKTFTIFSLSNVFTPNGDSTNDTWKITGIESYPNSEIKIVDKNGKLVVNKITNGSFEWDGKLNGRQLPTDSYWYQIKISDGRILEGYVVIKNRN
jgi:hypothetical protein